MSEPVLKPCPFCGGEPLIESESGFHSVRCVQCTDTDMNVKVVKFAKVEAVLDVWNNRAGEAALEYMLGERANESDLLRKEVERRRHELTVMLTERLMPLEQENKRLKCENAKLLAEVERLNGLVEALAIAVEDETGMLSDEPLTAEKLEEILHTLKHRYEYANEFISDYVKENARLSKEVEFLSAEVSRLTLIAFATPKINYTVYTTGSNTSEGGEG